MYFATQTILKTTLLVILFAIPAKAAKRVSVVDYQPDVIRKESTWNPRAIGPVGERGLMQIRRSTWNWATRIIYRNPLPFDKAFNPSINKKVGTWYLKWIQKTLKSKKYMGCEPSIDHILAAYNGGIGRLKKNKYRVSRMPRSTRQYVADVKRFHRQRKK